MIRRPIFIILAAIAVGAAAAVAQNDMSKVEIETTRVGKQIYMLHGAGGNIGVLAGPEGVLVIDGQYAPLTEKIRAAIATISDKPVRYVLNTHWHGDHSGGNQNFAAAGATVFAHDLVRTRMSQSITNPVFGWKSEPSPKDAMPVITFNDTLSFHLNGEHVICFHVPNAHTDGDVVVWIPIENIVHAGDVVFNKMYPIIDVGTGGSIAGMLAAQERILALCDDQTQIINGHGPIATKADLKASHDALVTVRDRVAKLLAEKKTLEQIQAAKPLADMEAQWGKSFVTSDLILKTAVLDLQRSK